MEIPRLVLKSCDLTTLAAVTSVYTRMAYGHSDVEPVRAPQPFPRTGKDCEETALFKRENERQRTLALDAAAVRTPVKVVELQTVEKEPVQAIRPARQVQPFVPFLAQQFIQDGEADGVADAASRRRHEAATDAYVLASDDGANILGPVRSREIVI